MVSPSTPRTEGGLYWGYRVRMAGTFGAVFTESPFKVRLFLLTVHMFVYFFVLCTSFVCVLHLMNAFVCVFVVLFVCVFVGWL